MLVYCSMFLRLQFYQIHVLCNSTTTPDPLSTIDDSNIPSISPIFSGNSISVNWDVSIEIMWPYALYS